MTMRFSAKETAGIAFLTTLLLLVFFSRALQPGRILAPTDILQFYPPFRGEPPGAERVQNPMPSDVVVQFHPWLAFQRGELREGRLPLWDPYNYCGAPLLANGQSAVFFPLSLIVTWTGFGLSLLAVAFLKLATAGFLAYLFLREVRLSPLAGAFGAVAFMFCGFNVIWLEFPNTCVSIFLPGLFLFTERISERRTPLLSYAGMAGIIALQFLGGHPETSLHIIAAAGAYFLFKVSARDLRRGGWRAALAVTGAYAASGMLGLLMASVQILPFLENLRASAMEAHLQMAGPNVFFPPRICLPLLFLPNLFGTPSKGYWPPGGDWPANCNFNEVNMGYVGAVALMLALAGALRLREPAGEGRRNVFFAALALLCLLVVYGVWPFFDFVTTLPLFRVTANHRLLLPLAFCLAVLAAYEIERLASDKSGGLWRAGAAFALLALVAAWAWIIAQPPPAAVLFTRGYILGNLGFAAGGVALVWARQKRWVSYRAAAMSVLLLLAVDSAMLFGRPLQSVIKREQFYPSNTVLEFLQPRCAPEYRALFAGGKGEFPPDLGSYYRIPGIRGYHALTPARYGDLQGRTADFLGNWQQVMWWDARLLDLLGVRYIVCERPRPLVAFPAKLPRGCQVGTLLGQWRHGQTFRATEDGLAGVTVTIETREESEHCDHVFHLKESPKSSEDLRTLTFNSKEFAGKGWKDFLFDLIKDSAGRMFYFEVESKAPAPGKAMPLRAYTSPEKGAYPEGTAFVDGQPAPYGVCFAALYPDGSGQEYPVVHHSSGMWVFENPNALPRAFLVAKAKAIPDGASLLDTLCGPDFDFRSCVLLEDGKALWPEAANPAPSSSSETLQARITRDLPCDIQVAAEAPGNGYLVLTDNYFPGWNAFVDGHPEPVLRADYTFRAVRIPAGKHEVRFVYQPVSFRAGAWISAVLWTCWLGAVVAGYRGRGRQPEEPSRPQPQPQPPTQPRPPRRKRRPVRSA